MWVLVEFMPECVSLYFWWFSIDLVKDRLVLVEQQKLVHVDYLLLHLAHP